jgi:NAD(P)-dependent dehydrogenase (short-subunit alcohol dehydrogenase family)
MKKENWSTTNIPDLTGKVIIVTGGNSGLGYESVKAFAEKGADVILTSRSVEKGEAAKKAIGKVKGNIIVLPLDLMDFSSIRSFTEKFQQKYKRLDVLLNNAGIMTTPYFLTKDGLEAQMGTNHFGHFALTGLLFGLIKNTPKSRIVNVSSMAHKQGKMDFSNLLFENGKGYSPIKSYGRSKLSTCFSLTNCNEKWKPAESKASQLQRIPVFRVQICFSTLKRK